MKRHHTLRRCLTSDTPVTTAPTLGFVQDLSVLVPTNYALLRDGFLRYLWSLHAGGPLALPTGCGPLLAMSQDPFVWIVLFLLKTEASKNFR